MQKMTIVGNLTADPILNEREYTNKETGEIKKVKVCNFTVAADNGFGDNQTTTFFRVNAWRGLADTCAKNLAKGRGVYLEGPITLNNYIGADRQLHSSMEVRAEAIQFLGKKVETPKETPDEMPDDMPY